MASRNRSGAGEYELRDDDFLISRTDMLGKITYANPAFIEVSGFSWDELNGVDHNIVRHPDMPREAFANLWSTIQSGRSWNGVVMNRRKNGDHYWVRAHVTPYYEGRRQVGYASVRTKAARDEIDFYGASYRRIIEGRAGDIRLERGEIRSAGVRGWLARLRLDSLNARLASLLLLALMMICASYLIGHHEQGQAGAALALLPLGMLAIAFLMWRIGRSVTQPLHAATEFNSQIAAGNLDARLPDFGNCEMGRLGRLMDTMRKSLASIATDVNKSLDTVAAASCGIARSNAELAARTEQQAAALQQTASSIEELMATVEQNAGNARHASKLAEDAAGSVEASGAVMHQVVSKMGSISQSSHKMGEIIGMIDAIAFQTNILALNASVEAARAGEQGRGFAVVASEVRDLARRSAEAAKEIRILIDGSVAEIDDGVNLVRQAEETIDGVIESVTKVNDIMAEISAASAEQSSGIGQINQAVSQLDVVTQQNASMVQAAAQVAANLQGQVDEMLQAITVFHIEQSSPEAGKIRGAF